MSVIAESAGQEDQIVDNRYIKEVFHLLLLCWFDDFDAFDVILIEIFGG